MHAVLALGLVGLAAASVVVLPGGAPKPLALQPAPASFDAVLRESAPSEFFNNSANIILSSYDGTLDPSLPATNLSETFPSGSSFIRSAIQAWGEHLHLQIRPDDVWFTILTQLNFYMEANAEEVRHIFVKHKGQETIFIEDTTWTRVLLRFKDEIQRRVLTPWLKDWIVPDFSTTRADDVMTANILMMGLMKAYFRYEGGIICGLPSVTLLGEKEDWEKLLRRLSRLNEFGDEPAVYRRRLTPILERFVRSFDEPDSPETREFWSRIVFADYSAVCGASPLELSGWITGFIFWDLSGQRIDGLKGSVSKTSPGPLTLDGITYHWHDVRRLPIGYAKAPFVMRDFGGEDRFSAYVAAGSLGKSLVQGPPQGYREALIRAGQDPSIADNKTAHGTVRPLSAWLLYGPLPESRTPQDNGYTADMPYIVARTRMFLEEGQCRGPRY
ncbi:hypothetical protein VTJ83DRAFT_5156 [Remersonia thermophila]|uniref:Uncharacterized protein n=1 Tax=Remersonia thermophila TaxID=72144 RepID=A0ABR4DBZ7_9PEZI